MGTISRSFATWIALPGSEVLFGIVLLPFILALDAVIFATARNTPGKAMLGIRVVDERGERLSFGDYLMRNFRLWIGGIWFGIPLVSLIPMFNQGRRLENGERASYDVAGGTNVVGVKTGLLRKIGFVLAWLALTSISTMMSKL